ncbi:MAG: 2-oxoacid:ferredoxin oxidoreductase subunit beta, partial [Ignavibacteria bacterium]|nr:2-oxoacid:ferredoxin oxidoreductase subunit beta [Ignavibacteria bacterium]
DPKHLQEMILRAGQHKGTAFVEVFQNCNIFNDGAFFLYTEKETRGDNVLYLKHNEPMVFGKENDKGIRMDCAKPTVVSLKDGKWSKDDLFVHDEFRKDPAVAFMLAHLGEEPGFPVPVGIIRQILKPTYDELLMQQIEDAKQRKGKGDLKKLLTETNTWVVN